MEPKWGLSTARAHSASHSAYCATPFASSYVNNMDTIMYRDINVSGCAAATVDFYYWLQTELGCDYLFYAGYYDGIWYWDYRN